MKKLLFKIATVVSALFITTNVTAQTAGTLTLHLLLYLKHHAIQAQEQPAVG